MNKITIRELYQKVLDGKNIIKKIKYRNEIFEFHEGENFYRHFDDYGSYWLPFDLDEKVIILDKKGSESKGEVKNGYN